MYSFRPAAESDRKVVYSLMERNMADYFQRFTPEGWSREKFDTGFKPERITICEEDGKVVGFYDADFGKEALYVRNVQVERGFRPISSVFVQRIEEEARKRGLKSVKGKVFKSNPAVRLFKRFGYEVTGEIESEHTYWMRKVLG